MPSLLQRAVLELGIDVPVWRSDIAPDGQALVLYLVGHDAPVLYRPPSTVDADPDPVGAPLVGALREPDGAGNTVDSDPVTTDDLTRIPGVGAKTADTLHQAGLHTFTDLLAADPAVLKHLVGAYTAAKIRDYLYVHFK